MYISAGGQNENKQDTRTIHPVMRVQILRDRVDGIRDFKEVEIEPELVYVRMLARGRQTGR